MANSQTKVLDLITGEIEDKFTPDGRERMDPNPIAAPLRIKRQPSYFEQIRESVKRELSDAAESLGMETFEEANDFAIGDDFEPYSPYEEQFGPDGRNQWDIAQDHVRGAETQSQKGGNPPAELPIDQNQASNSDDLT